MHKSLVPRRSLSSACLATWDYVYADCCPEAGWCLKIRRADVSVLRNHTGECQDQVIPSFCG